MQRRLHRTLLHAIVLLWAIDDGASAIIADSTAKDDSDSSKLRAPANQRSNGIYGFWVRDHILQTGGQGQEGFFAGHGGAASGVSTGRCVEWLCGKNQKSSDALYCRLMESDGCD